MAMGHAHTGVLFYPKKTGGGQMLKSILEEQLGILTDEEYIFAMEQELLNCCQVDCDVLNKLSTNIDYFRRNCKEGLN